jgi:uncharacterized protein YcfL
MNINKIILPAVVAALFVGGCNTTTSDSPNMRHYKQNTINDTHPRARLVLGSKDLVDKIVMVDVRMGAVGALQRAEVSVQNLTNKRYVLEYMYSWEDKDGFSINNNKVWQRFELGPREIRSFQSVGASPDAYGLTMTVRLPDDIFIHQEKTTK